MNRRKLFAFLGVSPVIAVGAVAQAKQPTEISLDKINMSDKFEIVVEGDTLHIRHKATIASPHLTITPNFKPHVI